MRSSINLEEVLFVVFGIGRHGSGGYLNAESIDVVKSCFLVVGVTSLPSSFYSTSLFINRVQIALRITSFFSVLPLKLIHLGRNLPS